MLDFILFNELFNSSSRNESASQRQSRSPFGTSDSYHECDCDCDCGGYDSYDCDCDSSCGCDDCGEW